MSTSTRPAPTLARPGAGELLWWLGTLTEIRLSATQTGGALSVIEVTEAPGAAAPRHVHRHDDETFVIQEGAVTLRVGDATITAGPGDIVFGPRGIPHEYVVGPEGCRMLFLLTPGGMETMVRAMSAPATDPTRPPDDAEPDWAAIAALATDHGCELSG